MIARPSHCRSRVLASRSDRLRLVAARWPIVAVALGLVGPALVLAAAGASLAALPSMAAVAFIVALVAKRWLGRGQDAWTLCVLVALGAVATFDARAAVVAMTSTLAVAVFAQANAQRRPGAAPGMSRVYYATLAAAVALSGFEGLLLAMLPSVLAVSASADSRATRFAFDGRGWIVVGLVAAARAAFGGELVASIGPAPGSLAAVVLAPGLVPFWLVAAAGIVGGLRVGHYATPFWRLAGCWLAAPVLLAALELVRPETAVASLLPPLALVTAYALRSACRQASAARYRWAGVSKPALDVVLVRVPARRFSPRRPVAVSRSDVAMASDQGACHSN